MAKPRTIGNMIAPWRFLVFAAIMAATIPFATQRLGNLALGLMTGFDIAAVIFFLLCVRVVATREAAVVHRHAKENDANRTGLIVITAIIMAVLLAAVGAETMNNRPEPLTKAIVISTLFLAWLCGNLVYAFHYAHLAYRGEPDAACSGLDFPGDQQPVYWDFIYFAFTLGMTFQTSDVTINDARIRKFVTMHSFGAFVFNIG